jgi:Zn-finger nucleic acid-binding protein
MEAATLRCPGCGAPASTSLHACSHCGSRLATAACPSCFGMVFRGTRHCPHCGARADAAPGEADGPLACPACAGGLSAVQVGRTWLRECGGCGGVWMDNAAFEALCAERERQASVLTFRAQASVPAPAETQIRYRACPECGALMHRLNFGRVSGVIVDVCREHGTWFDADELRRIVEFIQGGGLEMRPRGPQLSTEERERLDQAVREMRRPQRPAARERSRLAYERIFQAITRFIQE